MINLKNVNKTYHSKSGTDCLALKNINLELENKGMIFLIGKSGSGKSTLLNILGGLDTIDSGSLQIQDQEITQWKKKEYENYRNSFVGFIFQDFNIIEYLNVYENISLAIELQEKKPTKEELDNLLKKLDLEGLGNRKTNELSGGQKQRVAIARALIKNPEIILADEPTGNLDESSRKQIFEILKEISKEKLVLIVTHEKEAAEEYGNRMIQLQDGQIIKDTGLTHSPTTKKRKWKSSKLPSKFAFKLMKKNIFAKPFKRVMSIILLTFSLTFVSVTMSIFFYNEKDLAAKVMKKNNITNYEIEKVEKTKEQTNLLELTTNDQKELENLTKSIGNPVYKITNNGMPLSLEINYEFKTPSDNFFFYSNWSTPIEKFIEIKDEWLFENLLGRSPQNEQEMVIHRYLAEKIIYFGVKDITNEIYKPSSLEELIHDYHPLKLGENIVYISGIIMDDNSLFQKSLEKGNWIPAKLLDFFRKDYEKKSTQVYVKGLTKAIKLVEKKEEIINHITLQNEGKNYFQEKQLLPLQKEIKYITKEGIEIRSHLTQEEILLPISLIEKIDDQFSMAYKTFLSTNQETEENKINFITKYIKENGLNQGKYHLMLNVYNQSIELSSPKLLGITLDNYTYISDEFLTSLKTQNIKCTSMYFHETNQKKIKNAINHTTFSIPQASMTYNHFVINFSGDIQDTTYAYQQLRIYIVFICTIFILFSFILCLNVLTNSIMTNKKEIGILRALGTKEKDIIKIFQYEAFLIALSSWIFGSISYTLVCNWSNKKSLTTLFYQKDFISFHPFIPLLTLLFTILISLIITYFVTKNITKIKPIDAIHNK